MWRSEAWWVEKLHFRGKNSHSKVLWGEINTISSQFSGAHGIMAQICRIICGYLKRNRWGDLNCSIKGAFVLRIPEFRQNRGALSAD